MASSSKPQVISGIPPVDVRIDDCGEEDALETLAPFNSRVAAAIIDWVVACGILMGALWILPAFAGKLAWVLYAAYLVTRDSLPFLGGQSVGKMAMKLRVVTLDDRPLTGNWKASLIRNAVLLIPFLPLIELFVLLTREDKPGRGKRLGDEWAKTKVVLAPIAPPEISGV